MSPAAARRLFRFKKKRDLESLPEELGEVPPAEERPVPTGPPPPPLAPAKEPRRPQKPVAPAARATPASPPKAARTRPAPAAPVGTPEGVATPAAAVAAVTPEVRPPPVAPPPASPEPLAGAARGGAHFVAWEDPPAPAVVPGGAPAGGEAATLGDKPAGEGATAATILEGLCSRCGQPSRRGLCETCEAAFKELKELTFGYDEEY